MNNHSEEVKHVESPLTLGAFSKLENVFHSSEVSIQNVS